MLIAQAPANYYDGTAGLTGYALKTKLSQIITNGHQDNGYNGLWTAYSTTDRDYYYENNGKVLDMYSENPAGADPYEYTINSDQCGNYSGEGACYNREHVVPQSLFNSASPMRHDIHFIPPTDGKVNGMRSNYPYGVVNNPTWTSMNGSKLGPNSTPGFSGVVFEPINEFKGDIARMILYFATRYQSQIPSFSSGNILDGTTTRSIAQWELNVLLAWHNADPVSQREINRNNAAYAFQGNRNPYIDNPSWVQTVWGSSTVTPDNIPPSTPLNLAVNNITGGSAVITWTASTDNVGVAGYNLYLDGVLYGNTGTTTMNISGLNPNTTYTVTVEAIDAAGNISTLSAPLQFTTTNTPPQTGNSSELYFSEYVEGSGQNKALELTNATQDPIDLSNYIIKKQVNGTGSWDTPLVLTGTLQPNTAFVIKHSAAAFSCVFTADMTTGGTPLDFNGNDPIGLFKNGVLIDIIGTYNGGSANFAADITLRRNVSNPSTTFSLTQWDSLLQNTCDNIGIPNPLSGNLSTQEIKKTKTFSIYPNPVKNKILNVSGENLTSISKAEVIDLNGKIIQTEVQPFKTTDKIQLKNITKGVYILKLDNNTQKFIVE